ncbi:MAG: ATP-dependent DNA helicase RecG [Lachnospiraceae bacterium]|nr:ATP-dependent DNA helicase RecG [Lachnospiraceae bacterium]
MELTDSVKTIKGIGDKTGALLKKLDITTVGGLLEHYPSRYIKFDMPVAAGSVRSEGVVAIEGMFATTPVIKRSQKSVVTCTFADPTGSIETIWFNQPYIAKIIRRGFHYVIRGKVVKHGSRFYMQQPVLYTPVGYRQMMETLSPVYPLTEGLSSKVLQKAIKQVLPAAGQKKESFPASVRKKYGLMSYKNAIEIIHFPKSLDDMLEARRCLVFDELYGFAHEIVVSRSRREKLVSPFKMEEKKECRDFVEGLPYRLTGAQQRAVKDVIQDLTSGHVCNRLIQGDVGSGKTIVAAVALLLAAKNGCQACFMAPTEILARQHFEKFYPLFNKYGIRAVLLTGSLTASEKKKTLRQIKDHEADVIIGTHALIQDRVEYDSLGLVITDEQHRFGVRQRDILSEKSVDPHVIVMSATPIPRTLSLMLYGDLDISVINERPGNRLPVKNCVVGTEYREVAYRFIAEQVNKGFGAYVICPEISASEGDDSLENVEDYAAKLRERFAAAGLNITVGELHGQMKNDEKNRVMDAFYDGEINVLVSTTVVEVGVDVPTATVMMVECAERFGLAQLHQLRGRVGRGSAQSYCIFISTTDKEEAMERLSILGRSNDGFEIAEEDLRQRGPGDLLGLRQSGDMQFKLADVYRDFDILKEAFEAAKEGL